jgi:hypothetical protein
VDPDVLAPCVKTLANHFVTDRSSPEVMAVGLNAIREVCARCVHDFWLIFSFFPFSSSFP